MVDKKEYLEMVFEDIEDFMKSSLVWGYEGVKELSDRAAQVFIAFKSFLLPNSKKTFFTEKQLELIKQAGIDGYNGAKEAIANGNILFKKIEKEED